MEPIAANASGAAHQKNPEYSAFRTIIQQQCEVPHTP